ncbi:hypothetical protein [Gimesia sp.]|uniref:hypothetical protein n=1 Tax=Gimesia sp. TaxID=2024833 RepID=UPI0032EFAF6D
MRNARQISFLLLLICFTGCQDQENANVPGPTPQQEATNQAIMQEIQKLEQESASAEPPPPVFPLPNLPDWKRSAPRALPASDHGFSVAYDHAGGMTVTFYQFTRGLKEIPDNLNSEPVQNEMKHAKASIEQAVELGLWNSATETDHGTVSLGDSPQKALWCRYQLATDQGEVNSDTYVWSHANTFFKLRCTGHAKNPLDDVKTLTPLLTALGDACSEKQKAPTEK